MPNPIDPAPPAAVRRLEPALPRPVEASPLLARPSPLVRPAPHLFALHEGTASVSLALPPPPPPPPSTPAATSPCFGSPLLIRSARLSARWRDRASSFSTRRAPHLGRGTAGGPVFHQRPSLGKSLSIGTAKGSDSLSPKFRRDRLPRNLRRGLGKRGYVDFEGSICGFDNWFRLRRQWSRGLMICGYVYHATVGPSVLGRLMWGRLCTSLRVRGGGRMRENKSTGSTSYSTDGFNGRRWFCKPNASPSGTAWIFTSARTVNSLP